MIREARGRAHLTQTALAERSGIRQSVISEYETGRREPSVEALDRLLRSAGLALALTDAPDAPDALRQVRAHATALRALLTAHGASRIEVFGSVARGDDHPDSDIDLLVDLTPTVSVFDLLRMQSAAEALLGRAVDIVPRAGLKPDVAAAIRREAIPL